jgi:hypothetical protein
MSMAFPLGKPGLRHYSKDPEYALVRAVPISSLREIATWVRRRFQSDLKESATSTAGVHPPGDTSSAVIRSRKPIVVEWKSIPDERPTDCSPQCPREDSCPCGCLRVPIDSKSFAENPASK